MATFRRPNKAEIIQSPPNWFESESERKLAEVVGEEIEAAKAVNLPQGKVWSAALEVDPNASVHEKLDATPTWRVNC